jgi:hypothetical protein
VESAGGFALDEPGFHRQSGCRKRCLHRGEHSTQITPIPKEADSLTEGFT